MQARFKFNIGQVVVVSERLVKKSYLARVTAREEISFGISNMSPAIGQMIIYDVVTLEEKLKFTLPEGDLSRYVE